eukprot:CCRYP_015749-RA/>CCRYP_015749-RA protein AED:0.70 eAED:0.31 QI:0/-1/0/1/-1/0/1/0/188
MQQKYSVTEIELLAIVETLKEFKGMLWGQKIKVYTDHKNHIQDALGLTSDRVYRWRLLLEEYGLEIIHIKGIHNTVADAISRLDYSPAHNQMDTWMTFTQCWCHYASHTTSQQPAIHRDSMNLVFANRSEEEVIYPLTVNEITGLSALTPAFKNWLVIRSTPCAWWKTHRYCVKAQQWSFLQLSVIEP